MNDLVKELLDSIVTKNPSDMAILQLALLIERSNHIMKNKPEYLLNLSPDLLKIDLTVDQQREIITFILSHLDRKIVNSSLMWIIGKVHPNILVEVVQIWILENYQKLDANTLHQSLAALQNMFFSSEPEDYNSINPQLRYLELLMMARMLSNSSDNSVSHQAENLRQALDWYIKTVRGNNRGN